MGHLFSVDGVGLTAHYDSPEEVADCFGRVSTPRGQRRFTAFLPEATAIESFSDRRVLAELAGAFAVARRANCATGEDSSRLALLGEEASAMTSLVLTHYRPDKPTSGAPLRNWQNIRALASFGPVDVVTIGVEDARRPVEGLREWAPFSLSNRSAWDRFRKACAPLRPGIHPGIDLYYCSPVSSWLRKRGARGRYDVALIETIALAEYLDDLKQIANRVVFDAHNIESDLQPALEASTFDDSTPMVRRIKQRVLRQRLVSAERWVINGANLVWACSDEDARAIDRTYGRGTGVTVVPNGVDLDYYRRAGAPRVDADWSRLPVTMVYPGLFGYPPNDDAALRLIQQVLPGVRARGYSARIVLAGRNPTPALMAAAQRDAAVELTGAVESIVPHLDQPCIVTLPIAFGGGTTF